MTVRPLTRATRRELRRAVIAAHGDRCSLCGGIVDLTEPWDDGHNPRYPTLEHVIPQSHDGTHDVDNLRLAHKGCNSARGNRTPDETTTATRRWLA